MSSAHCRSLAGTLISYQTTAMIDVHAVFARVSLLELKRKYFWSILAYLA